MKIILLLTFIASIAHADIYDDRAQLAQNRSNQETIQKLQAHHAHVISMELMAIAKFGRAHSGYATQPDCFDFSYTSTSNSWRGSVRQICDHGICVGVHGESGGETYGDPVRVAIMNRESTIYYCKIVLNNGLACHAQMNFANNTYGGRCLDSSGNSRTLSIPFVWK